MSGMDDVFRAINDPSRRRLLDELYERDGQTLGELCTYLPEMTRYGVMNHLKILEEANLVTTVKRGRSKYHYLNPSPIQEIGERWISRFAAPRVQAMSSIKATAESGARAMDKPAHVYTTYIKANAADVWNAITNPEQTVQYFYGTAVDSTWEVGATMEYAYGDGTLASTGHIIAIDEPKRLEFTFHALWDDELKEEGPVREVWELNEMDGMVQLTIEVWDIAEDSKTIREFTQGFPYIVGGLKSLLETGESLPVPS